MVSIDHQNDFSSKENFKYIHLIYGEYKIKNRPESVYEYFDNFESFNIKGKNILEVNEIINSLENIDFKLSRFFSDELEICTKIKNNNYQKELEEYNKEMEIYNQEKEIMIAYNKKNLNIKLVSLVSMPNLEN